MGDFRTDRLGVEIVDWIGSNMTTRWESKETYDSHAKDPIECRSVGFVVHEDTDRVCLLQSESNVCFAEMITIPKLAITKRTVLEARKTQG